MKKHGFDVIVIAIFAASLTQGCLCSSAQADTATPGTVSAPDYLMQRKLEMRKSFKRIGGSILAPTGANPAAWVNYGGTWETLTGAGSKFTMELTQAGNFVNGTYISVGLPTPSRGKIEGTIDAAGNLTYLWTTDDGRNGTGSGIFHTARDSQSFQGWYSSDVSDPNKPLGSWTGRKIVNVAPQVAVTTVPDFVAQTAGAGALGIPIIPGTQQGAPNMMQQQMELEKNQNAQDLQKLSEMQQMQQQMQMQQNMKDMQQFQQTQQNMRDLPLSRNMKDPNAAQNMQPLSRNMKDPNTPLNQQNSGPGSPFFPMLNSGAAAMNVFYHGTWNLTSSGGNKFTMVLNQIVPGNTVTGTYSPKNGTISGQIGSDGRLTYRWTQEGGEKGTGIFSLSDRGNICSGSFSYSDDPTHVDGTWTGSRQW